MCHSGVQGAKLQAKHCPSAHWPFRSAQLLAQPRSFPADTTVFPGMSAVPSLGSAARLRGPVQHSEMPTG